jgi:FMN phosphatase YigB (HAD superfamily)
VPLRIAFDLDGVLADMDGELTRQAEALFGGAGDGRQRKLTARQGHR